MCLKSIFVNNNNIYYLLWIVLCPILVRQNTAVIHRNFKICLVELTSSGIKTESDSDPSSEKSDNLYEIVDSDESSNNSSVAQLNDDFDSQLPETVTLLRHPNGAKVYLVGTAHFSRESQEDVSKVIRNVRPHIVVLELCNGRTNILSLDEETVLREAKEINFDKIIQTVKSNGVYNGLMFILLLNMSAYLTKELGMAPGGEFRVAYKEVSQAFNAVLNYSNINTI